jgi:hypothetical protein
MKMIVTTVIMTMIKSAAISIAAVLATTAVSMAH